MSDRERGPGVGALDTPVEFVLLSRPDCHLCHEMQALLESELGRMDLAFEVRDVDSDPDWRREFGEVVPVLLRNGRPVAKIRADRQKVRRLVARSRAK